MNVSPLAPGRIDYIDAIKGFSILWVVVFHFHEQGTTILPSWMLTPYRMPLFFFLSGFFFRPKPFPLFVTQKINTLLIPFCCWYLLSWLLFVVLQSDLSWSSAVIEYTSPIEALKSIVLFGDLFALDSTNGFLYFFGFNLPLWFLFGLFLLQLLYYSLWKIIGNKVAIITLCAALYAIGFKANDWGITTGWLSLFALLLQYLLYYALGHITGPYLIQTIQTQKKTVVLLLVCLALGIFFNTTENWSGITTGSWVVWHTIPTISFIVIIFVLFKSIGKWKLAKPLIFFGKNSLAVLVSHMLLAQLLLWISDFFVPRQSIIQNPWALALQFLIVCAVNYFIIKCCNRYTPWIVGKKNLIGYK